LGAYRHARSRAATAALPYRLSRDISFSWPPTAVVKKEAAKAAFQQQPATVAPVISVAIGAGGVGHTLTAARIGIQAEQAWTPGETQQMKKRLHRIGQDRPVDYYITVAEGTIDEHLWQVVTAKQATLDAVLDGRSDRGAGDDEATAPARSPATVRHQLLTAAAMTRNKQRSESAFGSASSRTATWTRACGRCQRGAPDRAVNAAARAAQTARGQASIPARCTPARTRAITRGSRWLAAPRLRWTSGSLPAAGMRPGT
jgi:hypothetical protein